MYFDSVFGKADAGMVLMFKSLESFELRGFLGCSSAIYEAVLVDFFNNDSVRDDKVVSAILGKSVEISEELFAGNFEFPTEGLTNMHDVLKHLVFDARSAFSTDGQQLKTSVGSVFTYQNLNFEIHKT
ncbi:serine carboxypeptidase-like enzyme [Dorcoceras hygrometricum]|uniref:Serine carboxypeptidase-like enzyme n=1 Tax=Dorcoceras hygrometricum TaxID=472368 RepID=A0A2Z7CSB9_9LAMI|nr:serine carboxypeptidase-like enzyme [Dorcoceras hygrometricum]